ITKKPPVAEMIKKEVGKEKGSQKPGRDKIATLTMDQAKKIAENKLEDLNTDDVAMASRIVVGTARSMGIAVE
ncbi:MAG: uL11 family ribosomal protein, partial [Acidobacteriota bacterium]